MGTPVDKGRARGNWNVGVNEIDRSVNEDRLDPGGGTSVRAGQAKILADFHVGDVAFVTNGLPYIPDLEDGSSSQAPEGWIKGVAAQMRQLVARVLGKIASGQ
jgi:hypothetical protein